ncbi:MAG: 30S ribosomal protein S20 [Deltaproteobacteria bacterium]|nr:30S ribosomal protein S20 [Deltaproteobacteria bacterium]
MATHPSAEKRDRQNKKHKIRNSAVKSKTKTEIKKVLAAVEELNRESSEKALKSAITVLKKAASKGVYHKNNASRKVSRLTKKVNALKKA